MKELSNIENSILARFIIKYPLLRTHLPYLKIKQRKYTGVGMFIFFAYENIVEEFELPKIPENILATGELINMPGLIYGLSFEIGIEEGRLSYIEIVSNGEDWDGRFSEEINFSKF